MLLEIWQADLFYQYPEPADFKYDKLPKINRFIELFGNSENSEPTRGPTSWSGWKATYVLIVILLDFADYLIYYTRKEVTYELLTHEYNYWR